MLGIWVIQVANPDAEVPHFDSGWLLLILSLNDDISTKSILILIFILVLGIWVIRVAIPDAKVPHFGGGCLLLIIMIYMVYMVYIWYIWYIWYMVNVIWYMLLHDIAFYCIRF